MTDQPRVVMSFGMSFRPFQGRYMRVINQAKSLVEAGFDVTILAWDRECDGPEQETLDGVKIVRFQIKAPVGSGPKNIFKMLKFNWAVRKYLKQDKPDIVHCYNLDTIITSLVTARSLGAKAVLDLCEPNYYAMWEGKRSIFLDAINFVEAQFSKRYDFLCVHNEYQVRKFESHGLNNVLKAGSYPTLVFEASGTREFTKDTMIIGRVGSVYEDNGIEELLAAYRIILDKVESGEIAQKFKLLLAGRVFESYQETYDKLCEPFGDTIERIGAFPMTEIPALYGRIDIGTVLYRRTNWFAPITPTKLFDAMSCGVPLVATDMGEVKEILNESESGAIVDETNALELAEVIIALAADPDRRRSYAENASTASRAKYTWEVYKTDFINKYTELLEAPARLKSYAIPA
ncbi:MAG: glycosyltransferase family 4 protein [Verrucomicrobiota bacterium]